MELDEIKLRYGFSAPETTEVINGYENMPMMQLYAMIVVEKGFDPVSSHNESECGHLMNSAQVIAPHQIKRRMGRPLTMLIIVYIARLARNASYLDGFPFH
jgi:hypothetical protein